ncbi:MAG: phosphatidate cytidylyltransferase [Ruminococcus sp.]|nr:phosphatidate cytidylyltransferase [Ruminococcus sp.]
MSTRIKSAAVALVIAIVLLILHDTFVFNIALGFITAMAIWEIFRATKFDKHFKVCVACYAFVGLDALMPALHAHGWMTFFNSQLYYLLFIVAVCILYLSDHKNFTYTDFFVMIGVTSLVNYCMHPLIDMSRRGGGVFLLVITLCGAWLADSGAYFAGTFLGKTKLCPEISPKKTVEGLIGGVISNGVIMLIVSLVYRYLFKGLPVRFGWIFVAGMMCALIGLVGDLTASIIKRQTGIKDYGNIMPGHGGVMDRFDSVLLVAPFMFYLYTQGMIIG